MFNTFASDQKEKQPSPFNPIKIRENSNKDFQFANLSTIKLNPWNEQTSRSPTYLQHDNLAYFSAFPKANSKPISTLSKYGVLYEGNQKYYPEENKKFGQRLQKNLQFNILKRNRMRFSQTGDLKKMNKTISVHTIEGKNVFECLSKQKNQKINHIKTSQKQPKRRKSMIQNPMFKKFCNSDLRKQKSIITYANYSNEQNERNFTSQNKKHKSLSQNKLVKDQFINLIERISQNKLQQLRKRISSFSINRKQYERVQNIHEIRKRLKSTSQNRRNQYVKLENFTYQRNSNNINNNKKCQQQTSPSAKQKPSPAKQQRSTSKNQQTEIQGNKSRKKQEKSIQKSLNKNLIASQSHQDSKKSLINVQNLKNISKRKKSLYIGYRKYFSNQYSNNNKSPRKRQNTFQIVKQIQRKQDLNIGQIQKLGIIKNVPNQYYSKLQKQLKKINK